jgi:hypothetical protein
MKNLDRNEQRSAVRAKAAAEGQAVLKTPAAYEETLWFR